MNASLAVYFFGAGFGCGALDSGFAPLRRRRFFAAIPSDILLAAVAVGSHLLAMALWCDGLVYGYAVLIQILGYAVGRAACGTVMKKLRLRFGAAKQKRAKSARTR